MSPAAIIGLLIALEIARRLGAAMLCFVDLRYSTFLFEHPHASLMGECIGRHLFFPFGL